MIRFMSMDGKTFFECHESEARAAKDMILDMRNRKNFIPKYLVKSRDRVSEVIQEGIPRKVIQIESPFSFDEIIDAYADLESQDIRPTFFAMNHATYTAFRSCNRKFGGDLFEAEKDATNMMAGRLAKLYGANVFVIRELADKELYIGNEDVGDFVRCEFVKLEYELEECRLMKAKMYLDGLLS